LTGRTSLRRGGTLKPERKPEADADAIGEVTADAADKTVVSPPALRASTSLLIVERRPGDTRWEHEDVIEAVQARLDKNPDAMRTRRETVEHSYATIKIRMGATHFLCKTLPKVATELTLFAPKKN
jgi:hypothetical protein